MLAYALYLNDARIKAYVKTLEQSGTVVDVVVVREPGKPRVEVEGNVRIIHLTSKYAGRSTLCYIWSYLRFVIASFLTLSYLASRTRYTAVHVHNMPNILVVSAVLPRLLGARLILDVHDLMPANYMAKFDAGEHDIALKCLVLEQRVSALIASHVLCADHSQKEYLEDTCRIASRKLSVVLNLPHEQTFRRVERTRTGSQFELVYHGTIARRLGIDIMLAAVARVPDEIPLRLSVYGSGDFLEQALEIAHGLGVEDKVYFSQSFFPVEQIPAIVADMDVGVIANRRTVACDKFMLPVKLLEYVYLGIPVIAPRLEIIRRYFDESMLKYYEPESDADLTRCIVELYQSPAERDRMRRSASRFYRRYNWNCQAQAYLNLVHAWNRWRC